LQIETLLNGVIVSCHEKNFNSEMTIVTNKSQTKNGIFDVSSSNQVQSRGLKFDALRRVRDVRKCWRGRNM